MTDWLRKLNGNTQEKVLERSFPDWLEPMLAKLTHDYFSDDQWIFERKLDGQRCLTYCDGDGITLYSRNRKQANDRYPEIVESLDCKTPFIADGEIVAFEGTQTSFSRLQPRMQLKDPEKAKQSKVDVYYYLFDLLYLDGYLITELPLRKRKSILKAEIRFQDPIRYLQHRNTEGEAFFKEACKKEWEGLIAKRADATYKQSRSSDWLKFKCLNRQEFVIGGYTNPQGERLGFGALLVGYHEDDHLKYAGKVGTGFDDDTLKSLHEHLTSLERKTSPFKEEIPENGVHWVTPKLVAEIGFTEWTNDNKMRHPRFLGLRGDKSAEQVVKED